MRAASFDQHGGPEVLTIRDWADPEPGPGQVRVRVAGCGVNHLDIFVRQGIPGVGPFPHIPGSEVSGTIDRLGAGVEPGRIEVGTAVVVAPGRGCGRCRDCRRGRDNLCADFRVLGNQRQGGFAEFVVVEADDCIPVGDRIPLEDWAAVPLVFQTAWNMLHALGSVQSGDEVLVESAGSGVGTAAIQVATLAGARVIATAGGAEKCERLRSMGVERVIDHTCEDVRKSVLSSTSGRGVDIVVSHVGGAAFVKSLGCLARGGRLVTCGATAGPKIEVDYRFVFTRELTIRGAYLGSRADLDAVVALVDAGRLAPVIDRRLPLDRLDEAHRLMAERNQFGKTIILPTIA